MLPDIQLYKDLVEQDIKANKTRPDEIDYQNSRLTNLILQKKYTYTKYNKIGFYVSIFPLIHVSKYDSPFRTFKGYTLTF